MILPSRRVWSLITVILALSCSGNSDDGIYGEHSGDGCGPLVYHENLMKLNMEFSRTSPAPGDLLNPNSTVINVFGKAPIAQIIDPTKIYAISPYWYRGTPGVSSDQQFVFIPFTFDDDVRDGEKLTILIEKGALKFTTGAIQQTDLRVSFYYTSGTKQFVELESFSHSGANVLELFFAVIQKWIDQFRPTNPERVQVITVMAHDALVFKFSDPMYSIAYSPGGLFPLYKFVPTLDKGDKDENGMYKRLYFASVGEVPLPGTSVDFSMLTSGSQLNPGIPPTRSVTYGSLAGRVKVEGNPWLLGCDDDTELVHMDKHFRYVVGPIAIIKPNLGYYGPLSRPNIEANVPAVVDTISGDQTVIVMTTTDIKAVHAYLYRNDGTTREDANTKPYKPGYDIKAYNSSFTTAVVDGRKYHFFTFRLANTTAQVLTRNKLVVTTEAAAYPELYAHRDIVEFYTNPPTSVTKWVFPFGVQTEWRGKPLNDLMKGFYSNLALPGVPGTDCNPSFGIMNGFDVNYFDAMAYDCLETADSELDGRVNGEYNLDEVLKAEKKAITNTGLPRNFFASDYSVFPGLLDWYNNKVVPAINGVCTTCEKIEPIGFTEIVQTDHHAGGGALGLRVANGKFRIFVSNLRLHDGSWPHNSDLSLENPFGFSVNATVKFRLTANLYYFVNLEKIDPSTQIPGEGTLRDKVKQLLDNAGCFHPGHVPWAQWYDRSDYRYCPLVYEPTIELVASPDVSYPNPPPLFPPRNPSTTWPPELRVEWKPLPTALNLTADMTLGAKFELRPAPGGDGRFPFFYEASNWSDINATLNNKDSYTADEKADIIANTQARYSRRSNNIMAFTNKPSLSFTNLTLKSNDPGICQGIALLATLVPLFSTYGVPFPFDSFNPFTSVDACSNNLENILKTVIADELLEDKNFSIEIADSHVRPVFSDNGLDYTNSLAASLEGVLVKFMLQNAGYTFPDWREAKVTNFTKSTVTVQKLAGWNDYWHKLYTKDWEDGWMTSGACTTNLGAFCDEGQFSSRVADWEAAHAAREIDPSGYSKRLNWEISYIPAPVVAHPTLNAE